MWEFMVSKEKWATFYIYIFTNFQFLSPKTFWAVMFMVLYTSNGSSKNLRAKVTKGITIDKLLFFKKFTYVLNKS